MAKKTKGTKQSAYRHAGHQARFEYWTGNQSDIVDGGSSQSPALLPYASRNAGGRVQEGTTKYGKDTGAVGQDGHGHDQE